ncbi:hypothetical protein FPV67DRAFT_787589 [Lyophyllum atratum]|nr:hypothetical protein FPV67DRAFT_787589 [Lyophyllum atratum]
MLPCCTRQSRLPGLQVPSVNIPSASSSASIHSTDRLNRSYSGPRRISQVQQVFLEACIRIWILECCLITLTHSSARVVVHDIWMRSSHSLPRLFQQHHLRPLPSNIIVLRLSLWLSLSIDPPISNGSDSLGNVARSSFPDSDENDEKKSSLSPPHLTSFLGPLPFPVFRFSFLLASCFLLLASCFLLLGSWRTSHTFGSNT